MESLKKECFSLIIQVGYEPTRLRGRFQASLFNIVPEVKKDQKGAESEPQMTPNQDPQLRHAMRKILS